MQLMPNENAKLETILNRLNIDSEGRACRDIPEQACREEPRNVFVHVVSLSLTKIADGLIDPKLVLSWLLTHLGASSLLIGLLVPIREAGALLPQLFTAGALRQMPLRKYAWAMGSLVQGVMAIGIGLSALLLPQSIAPIAILICLTILALARSVCSVTIKDVLGKTVSKSRRGQATGMAGSISAAFVILFAALLTFDLLPRYGLVISGLIIAGGCWIISALFYTFLKEYKGAVTGGKNAITAAIENLSLLRTERDLQIFIVTRALLTVTALAPPFMIAATSESGGQSLGQLGLLVFSSATAALLSAYIWGWLSDRSSRKVLLLAALISGAILALTAISAVTGWLALPYVLPALLFVLMLAYQGVRLGRATHLIDMATDDTRAAYTALSNTVIGLILLLGGVFGVIAAIFGLPLTLGVMSVMSFLAAISSLKLDEVQKDA